MKLGLLTAAFPSLSLEEVAAVLRIGVPALKSRMHRSRAALRRALVEVTP